MLVRVTTAESEIDTAFTFTVLLDSDNDDLVDDWEVAKLVAGKTADESCGLLVQLANERGGHDNITVAVVVAGDRSDPYDPDYIPPAPEEAAPAASSILVR